MPAKCLVACIFILSVDEGWMSCCPDAIGMRFTFEPCGQIESWSYATTETALPIGVARRLTA